MKQCASGGTSMAYQITLSEDDYQRLADAAQKHGTTIEKMLHKAINDFGDIDLEAEELIEYPSGEQDNAQMQTRDQEIAARLGTDKPWLSEMILEDRGPR
jgi:predicted DNA-binding protein